MQLKDFKQVSSQSLSNVEFLANRLERIRYAAIGSDPQGIAGESDCEKSPENLEASMRDFFSKLNMLLDRATHDIDALEQSLAFDEPEATCAQVRTAGGYKSLG